MSLFRPRESFQKNLGPKKLFPPSKTKRRKRKGAKVLCSYENSTIEILLFFLGRAGRLLGLANLSPKLYLVDQKTVGLAGCVFLKRCIREEVKKKFAIVVDLSTTTVPSCQRNSTKWTLSQTSQKGRKQEEMRRRTFCFLLLLLLFPLFTRKLWHDFRSKVGISCDSTVGLWKGDWPRNSEVRHEFLFDLE